MFEARHYVPILKWKAGEYQGLSDVTAARKALMTPLAEVVPIPWDYENEAPAKTALNHLEAFPAQALQAWGPERPFFVDVEAVPSSEVLPGNRHPLTYLFDESRAVGLKLVPVTGLSRDTLYQAAVSNAVAIDHLGVCIRLQAEDFEDFDATDQRLADLLGDLEVTEAEVDLVIDLGPTGGPAATMVLAARSIIQSLPRLAAWRSLTLASASFPQDLTGVAAQSTAYFQRTDWQLWLALVTTGTKPARIPSYGDYAVAHPVMVEMDPRIMRMSASIRYAADSEWVVLKGQNTRQYGFAQFHNLSAQLIVHPQFSGAGYSWADDYISQCAAQTVGTGNATTWRRVATNRHLSLTADQVATVPGI